VHHKIYRNFPTDINACREYRKERQESKGRNVLSITFKNFERILCKLCSLGVLCDTPEMILRHNVYIHNTMKEGALTKLIKIFLLIILVYLFLITAKPFLVPIAFAGIFSMLLLPVSIKLEDKGVNRGIATTLSILVLLLFVALVAGLLAWQVADLSKSAQNIEKNITKKVEELKDFASQTFGISEEKQEEIIEEQKKSSDNMMKSMIKGSVATIGSTLTNVILVIVYIFLFLYFRTHLKNFVLMRVKDGKESKAKEMMQSGRKVAQKYLTGLAMMIAGLWVMYGIGFSIVGVKNSVFFAVLCGLLEIVPFVGNLAGVIITLLMTIAQGGDSSVLIGIIITYSLVQFIQTYFMEPLVVGREVNVHPMFTIIGLVAGEFVWGIPGMILAIPLMGIAKIIFDRVESLKDYGYLIGENKDEKKGGLVSKIKKTISKKV
jgi:predicted PurR-regulated permease PerM